MGDKSIGVVSKQPESAKKDQQDLISGFDTFHEALRLVVNSLFYISQYPKEIKDSWPVDTPQPLLERLRDAKTAKQIRRTTSTLAAMGYTKIKICGSSIGGIITRREGNSAPIGAVDIGDNSPMGKR